VHLSEVNIYFIAILEYELKLLLEGDVDSKGITVSSFIERQRSFTKFEKKMFMLN
jgi:hypothetical protein